MVTASCAQKHRRGVAAAACCTLLLATLIRFQRVLGQTPHGGRNRAATAPRGTPHWRARKEDKDRSPCPAEIHGVVCRRRKAVVGGRRRAERAGGRCSANWEIAQLSSSVEADLQTEFERSRGAEAEEMSHHGNESPERLAGARLRKVEAGAAVVHAYRVVQLKYCF